MAIEIIIPRLGWSMEEGTFAGWLKAAGDRVAAGEPLFAVESDKVTMDVESLDSGILHLPPDAPQTGSPVTVGQRIGYLLAEGEQPPAHVPAGKPVAAPSAAPATHEPARTPVATSHRRAVTPRARRVAAELGVDVSALRGTGVGGRVRETDVRAAAVPASRRTIASRMEQSARNTVPVTLTTRAEAANLVRLKESTPGLSYTAILVSRAAAALQLHPRFGGRHIGVAVDTEHGLFVPVIRDVPSLSLEQIAARIRELTAAAHSRSLKPEDLHGGTFSISNLGGFGIDFFTPVINYPEVAILGVGAIRSDPSPRIGLSLTFDHRVADGAPAARFLQTLVRMIEQ